jgi:hypothetical protein
LKILNKLDYLIDDEKSQLKGRKEMKTLELFHFCNVEKKAKGQCYKTSLLNNPQLGKISWSTCPWQTFPAKLIFVGKACACQSVVP